MTTATSKSTAEYLSFLNEILVLECDLIQGEVLPGGLEKSGRDLRSFIQLGSLYKNEFDVYSHIQIINHNNQQKAKDDTEEIIQRQIKSCDEDQFKSSNIDDVMVSCILTNRYALEIESICRSLSQSYPDLMNKYKTEAGNTNKHAKKFLFNVAFIHPYVFSLLLLSNTDKKKTACSLLYSKGGGPPKEMRYLENLNLEILNVDAYQQNREVANTVTIGYHPAMYEDITNYSNDECRKNNEYLLKKVMTQHMMFSKPHIRDYVLSCIDSIPLFNYRNKLFRCITIGTDVYNFVIEVSDSKPIQRISLLSSEIDCRILTNEKYYNLTNHDQNNVQPEMKLETSVNDIMTDTTSQLSGFDRIGGLTKVLSDLEESLIIPILYPEVFQKYEIKTSKGVILHGPPGTGKSLVCKAFIEEVKKRSLAENKKSPDIRTLGPSSDVLKEFTALIRECRTAFEADKNQQTLILLDEIDAICPDRSNMNTSEMDRKVVAGFLTLIDGIDTSSSSGIHILATTNRLDAIDPAIRRSGRLSHDIELGIPTANDRYEILKKLLPNQCINDETEQTIKYVSENAHAFVGADLNALMNKAKLIALNRELQHLKESSDAESEESRMPVNASRGILLSEDILTSFQSTSPSGMVGIEIQSPNVKWTDIGGYEEVKQIIKECVDWPQMYGHIFKKLNIRPPCGILLYGPPGCCKTLLAKAVATESGRNFLNVKGPELFNMYVGESEAAVRTLFQKARLNSPSVVFIDEIEAMGVSRSGTSGTSVEGRVLAQMLVEMDGVGSRSDVIVMGATNRPEILDKALTRPGRLDRIVLVDIPDPDARRAIFNIYLSKISIEYNEFLVDIDSLIDHLVQTSEGFTGAEIEGIVKDATFTALRNQIKNFKSQDDNYYNFNMNPVLSVEILLQTLKEAVPNTTPEMIQFYRKFAATRAS